MQGWMKLYRQVMENYLWLIKPFSKGQAWVDLLLLTNHKKAIITIKNGLNIPIERGECGYSVLALADRWGWSRGKVNRFLKELQKQKMIQQKIVSNHSVIKLLNYEFYQGEATNSTTKATTKRQQTNINKNDKNYKNYKNEKYEKLSD